MTSQISQQQLVEYSEAFSLYDIDDTNSIAVARLQMVVNTLGITLPQAKVDEILTRKADEGDANITFEEFLYLVGPENTSVWQHTENSGRARSKKLQAALGVFDTQGYGIISTVDLRRALREALHDHEIDDLVKKVDPKQTGKVDVQSLAEFLVGY
jgi:calmodulin